MLTTRIDLTYDSLPEEDRLALMAVSVLIQRIQSLAKADRDDLFELFQGLLKTEDRGEIQSIRRTMEEILAQSPVTVRPMPLEEGSPTAKRLNGWADHVGRKIRELREKAGLNQVQLARKSGLTQSHISRLERAQHSATNLTLEKIAAALDVSVRDIDICVD